MPIMEPPIPTPLPEHVTTPKRLALSQNSLQFLRFGLVGCLNTLTDLLALNCLLWLWPTQNTALLLLANSLAYALGALNSFILNRYWTFQQRGRTNTREVSRFILTTLAGITCNDFILGSLNSSLQMAHLNTAIWMNLAKLAAIGSTVFISYLGMRLWVFVQQPQAMPKLSHISGHCLQKGNTSIMAHVEKTALASTPAFAENKGKYLLPQLWQKLAFCAVMLVSIFMNFYQLGQNGFGNLFYAAGVRSMADSFHNFFFASYDPGGFVTVDKPPLGFWLQAISVKLFGFTPFSIFLPQALAGVLSVFVLFFLVRRHFGVAAGLLAALALALSPLSVATDRNNTIDSTLTLMLLLGAWAMLRATETGKWRWLLLSATLVGIGFNIKMAEAYLVVPAFGLLYLLGAPRRLWTRLGQLSLATLLLLAISLSWATAVDLIPASQRPYVGSSQHNSEIDLAFGYNGLDRILGRFNLGNAAHSETRHLSATDTATVAGDEQTISPKTSALTNLADTAQRTRRNFGMFGSGAPGPLRLFQEPLGGQISWLLPFALLGILALAWQRRPRFQADCQQQSLLLWGTWVLTMASFFSIAGFFHQYYMTTFAPAICALFGIGLVLMWQDYQRAGWRGWLLPLALVVTAGEQVYLIQNNPAWGTELIPLIAIPCTLTALILCILRVFPYFHVNTRALLPILGCGIAALLLTPAIWSAIPALQNSSASTPTAGPTREYDVLNVRNNKVGNTALAQYLLANQGNAKFLVATPSSMSADTLILATNQPVMAMGGFSGRDPILTTNQLSTLVANGTVRFFLLNNPTFLTRNFAGTARNGALSWFGFGRNSQNALTSWVAQHCTTVPINKWQASTASTPQSNAMMLYDCAEAQ